MKEPRAETRASLTVATTVSARSSRSPQSIARGSIATSTTRAQLAFTVTMRIVETRHLQRAAAAAGVSIGFRLPKARLADVGSPSEATSYADLSVHLAAISSCCTC
jgi:hypothetical protein